MALSLPTIANELILSITQFLDSKEHLSRLSQCSKHLYELVLPELYFSFEQTGRWAIPSFVRTLLSKPHLARYVKLAEFWALTGSEEGTLVMTGSEEGTLLGFVEGLGAGGEEESIEWLSRIRAGQWDASAAILLTLLPNLTTIHITHTPVLDSGPISNRGFEYLQLAKILSHATTLQNDSNHFLPSSLSKLSKVTFKKHDSTSSSHLNKIFKIQDPRYIYRGPPMEVVLPFLQLKSIKSLSCPDLLDGREDWLEPINFHMECKTSAIRFSSYNISNYILRDLLLGFSSLKKSSYARTPDRIGLLLGHRLLMDGLANSVPGLEELAIVSPEEVLKRDFRSRGVFDRDLHSPIGSSLKGFTNLKRLEISSNVFFGRFMSEELRAPVTNWECRLDFRGNEMADVEGNMRGFVECLPEGLRSLGLLECGFGGEASWGFIETLLRKRGVYIPALREVYVDGKEVSGLRGGFDP